MSAVLSPTLCPVLREKLLPYLKNKLYLGIFLNSELNYAGSFIADVAHHKIVAIMKGNCRFHRYRKQERTDYSVLSCLFVVLNIYYISHPPFFSMICNTNHRKKGGVTYIKV